MLGNNRIQTPSSNNAAMPALKQRPIWLLPAYLLFFLMLFAPTAYQPVKGALIAVVVFLIFSKIVMNDGKVVISKPLFFWTALLTTTGLAFSLYGFIVGNPGALPVITVHVIWPLLYTIFILGITKKQIIDGLFKVLIFSMIVIELYSLHYIFHFLGWLPDSLYLDLSIARGAFMYAEGYMEFSVDPISTLIFLIPFTIAALLVWPRKESMPVSRGWLWICLLLGVILTLLSGRRALMLCVAVAPVVALFLRAFLTRQQKQATRGNGRRLVFIGTGLLLIALVYLQNSSLMNVSAIKEMFLAGFDFQHDGGASLRAQQYQALMDGWASSPFFGQGLGAAAEVIRSEDMPWAYELQYISLLFQTGIIGTLLYVSAVAWIYFSAIRIIRSGQWMGLYILPVMVGTTTFLIANATNPYLGKYDNTWTLFLPIALINYWLLKRKQPLRQPEQV